MEDAIVNFVMTGKLNFADFTRSILADMARIIVRQSLLAPLKNIFPFLQDAAGNANGNAFAANGVIPYRKGGVVDSPTYFKYGGSNLGILGEAGAEAIMPLKRNKEGKLGVISSGGMSTTVNVSVNANSTSVEGEYDKSKQLGKVVAAAIQQQLILERRPGGLLHG